MVANLTIVGAKQSGAPLQPIRWLITEVQLTRIIFGRRPLGMARSNGTISSHTSTSTTFTLKAKKEVILAAGTLQTPQLHMVSGVGPEKILKQYGIKVIQDLPGVGQGMQDHLFFSMVHKVDTVTLSQTLTHPVFTAKVENEYNQYHTGILTHTGADYFASEKLPSKILHKTLSTSSERSRGISN
jgi:choline dehydrogenase